MFPDRERRIIVWNGQGHEGIRHEHAETLCIAGRARAEPRDSAGEALEPGREALRQGRFRKERLEPEGVERCGGEGEARPLQELAEPRLTGEGQTMPAALEGIQR